ncbi:YdjY domain-containing protein [Haloferula helveola]
MRLLWLTLPLLALVASGAEPVERAPVEPKSLPAPDQKVEPAKPAIERLEDGRMKVGEVTFDPKTREIRFPAEVNMTEGLLEFFVVHRNGKVHESLLLSDISATNLNIAFKLLKYKASRELYVKVEEDGSLSNEFEEATPEEKKESRLKLLVEWKDGEETKSVSANDLIAHAATEKAMPKSPWVYGGSFVYDGKFVAETSGDLMAIFLSNSALINFSGEDNELDDVWLPHPTRVPAQGTKVTVLIQPYEP